MSIRPNFAEAIIRGQKQVEFRKRPIANDVTHVLVYATRPVSGVIGAFTVAGQEISSPSSLWESFGDLGYIASKEFEDYFRSCQQGTCIRVGEVFWTTQPISIEEVLGHRRPPQSFQYIAPELASLLLAKMHSPRDAN
jgi:predicted transcriptional regulator